MKFPLPQNRRQRVVVRVLIFLEDADAAEELVRTLRVERLDRRVNGIDRLVGIEAVGPIILPQFRA